MGISLSRAYEKVGGGLCRTNNTGLQAEAIDATTRITDDDGILRLSGDPGGCKGEESRILSKSNHFELQGLRSLGLSRCSGVCG